MGMDSLALSGRFVDILNKYENSLVKINIINTNEFVKLIFEMLTPFLSDRLVKMI